MTKLYDEMDYLPGPIIYKPIPQAPDAGVVAELVEAAKAFRNAVCGDTGFAAAVRLHSGNAYPWPALDLADEWLLNTLAKLETRA